MAVRSDCFYTGFERVDVVTVAYSDVLKSGEPGDKYWHDVAVSIARYYYA